MINKFLFTFICFICSLFKKGIFYKSDRIERDKDICKWKKVIKQNNIGIKFIVRDILKNNYILI